MTSESAGALAVVRTLARTAVKGGVSLLPGGSVLLIGAGEAQRLAKELAVDLDDMGQMALADELQRLHQMLSDIRATSATPEEAYEIALNVMQCYPRTLRREKRKLLTNVLVNGLASELWDGEKEPYFARAMIELEPEHIDTLRRYTNETLLAASDVFRAPTGTTTGGYLHQLQGWQFVAAARYADSAEEFVVTRLGAEFLQHLWDRDGDANPFSGLPELLDLRRACRVFEIAADPIVRRIVGFELAGGQPLVRVIDTSDAERVFTAAEVGELMRAFKEAPRF